MGGGGWGRKMGDGGFVTGGMGRGWEGGSRVGAVWAGCLRERELDVGVAGGWIGDGSG